MDDQQTETMVEPHTLDEIVAERRAAFVAWEVKQKAEARRQQWIDIALLASVGIIAAVLIALIVLYSGGGWG